MNLKFAITIPEYISAKPILISGENSNDLSESAYLIYEDLENTIAYEIKYEYQCSPFKEAKILDNLLAVGHERHFYLFDTIEKSNILTLEVSGYFGHLYFFENTFYVTSAFGIYAISKNGKLLWENSELAVDGVIISRFNENEIFGTGELNPPGGWKNFIINKNNGEKLK